MDFFGGRSFVVNSSSALLLVETMRRMAAVTGALQTQELGGARLEPTLSVLTVKVQARKDAGVQLT